MAQAIREWSLEQVLEPCDGALIQELAAHDVVLSQAQREALLATAVSFRFAPYGGSTALTRRDLAKEGQLDCDNYAAIVMHLLEDQSRELQGFMGGYIGNHAQVGILHIPTGSASGQPLGEMVVDPTVGVVAFGTPDDVVSGRPVKMLVLIDGARPDPAAVRVLRERVQNALLLGLYRPSDILYVFGSIRDYRRSRGTSDWATPALSPRRR